MADVQLRGVCKAFGDIQAVSGLDLEIADGDFVVLLGPTGAGKTTTLRLIAGLEAPDDGFVSIGGRDVADLAPAARDVSFVFQQYSLYPHLSVFDNLAFPLRSPARPTSKPDIERIVKNIAQLLHIESKLANKATNLSGGEMQRVAIGRALVRDPAIYLMDEPLSSLDAKLRGEMRVELKRIHQEKGATILYVTHDQIEAMTMATHVGVLNEGVLVQYGTPREIYENPSDVYVATRLGLPRINLAPPDLFDIEKPPATSRLGLRTEHIVLGGEGGSGRSGRISNVEHLGDQTRLYFDIEGVEIVTLADPHMHFAVGDEIQLGVHDPLFFDADDKRIYGS